MDFNSETDSTAGRILFPVHILWPLGVVKPPIAPPTNAPVATPTKAPF